MSSFAAESVLTRSPESQRLELATGLGVTPTGLVESPVFFSGFLDRPDVAASGLLAVADVAASRYADAGLAARLASMDPVVTAGGTCLRFESFSACNGVHARFDLLREGLGGGEVGFGTTNVDINPPLRKALARVNRAEAMHLSVGRDELRASSLAGTHVERKVNLPERWVRGLAEVPALTAAMTRVAELRGPAIARFFSTLPRVAPPGPSMNVLPMPSGWRLATRALPKSFPLPGVSRLRGADRIIRHASRLAVYVNVNGTTAWVFDVPGGRFTLVLSPDPFRGFSGEGTLLTLLTDSDAESHGRRVLAELGWTPLVDPKDLAERTGLGPGKVASGLGWLAACGRLGYDLTEGAWFHRELPIDSDKVLRRNPRLASARKLLESGSIRDGSDGWKVEGSYGNRYTVTKQLRCDCAWGVEHDGNRGPCKHVLAAILTFRDSGLD
ncbi:SWIM zinc finger family protein [Segeticoccus rhizosphaerae]|uniref:SWIM zinc finger family protein n=1 Tax=Segeticoccus rhizosphaerae TaxID=1104777 RepID=UPI0010BFD572|nr:MULTISPECIES: SWIM zinc finger family protein [Intrasporangiaceae]